LSDSLDEKQRPAASPQTLPLRRHCDHVRVEGLAVASGASRSRSQARRRLARDCRFAAEGATADLPGVSCPAAPVQALGGIREGDATRGLALRHDGTCRRGRSLSRLTARSPDARMQRIALVWNPRLVGAARAPSRALASRAERKGAAAASRDESSSGRRSGRRLQLGRSPLCSGCRNAPGAAICSDPATWPLRAQSSSQRFAFVWARQGERLTSLLIALNLDCLVVVAASGARSPPRTRGGHGMRPFCRPWVMAGFEL
jgi:hypothetical protein